MRKTRLVIQPKRCLHTIGFLLLYMSCPVIGDWGRIQPDTDMAHRAVALEREGARTLIKDPPSMRRLSTENRHQEYGPSETWTRALDTKQCLSTDANLRVIDEGKRLHVRNLRLSSEKQKENSARKQGRFARNTDNIQQRNHEHVDTRRPNPSNIEIPKFNANTKGQEQREQDVARYNEASSRRLLKMRTPNTNTFHARRESSAPSRLLRERSSQGSLVQAQNLSNAKRGEPKIENKTIRRESIMQRRLLKARLIDDYGLKKQEGRLAENRFESALRSSTEKRVLRRVDIESKSRGYERAQNDKDNRRTTMMSSDHHTRNPMGSDARFQHTRNAKARTSTSESHRSLDNRRVRGESPSDAHDLRRSDTTHRRNSENGINVASRRSLYRQRQPVEKDTIDTQYTRSESRDEIQRILTRQARGSDQLATNNRREIRDTQSETRNINRRQALSQSRAVNYPTAIKHSEIRGITSEAKDDTYRTLHRRQTTRQSEKVDRLAASNRRETWGEKFESRLLEKSATIQRRENRSINSEIRDAAQRTFTRGLARQSRAIDRSPASNQREIRDISSETSEDAQRTFTRRLATRQSRALDQSTGNLRKIGEINSEAARDDTQRTFTRQQAIHQSRASDQPAANNQRELRDTNSETRDDTQRIFTRRQSTRQSRVLDQLTAGNRREIRDTYSERRDDTHRTSTRRLATRQSRVFAASNRREIRRINSVTRDDTQTTSTRRLVTHQSKALGQVTAGNRREMRDINSEATRDDTQRTFTRRQTTRQSRVFDQFAASNRREIEPITSETRDETQITSTRRLATRQSRVLDQPTAGNRREMRDINSDATRDDTHRTFTRRQATRQSRAFDQFAASNRREIRVIQSETRDNTQRTFTRRLTTRQSRVYDQSTAGNQREIREINSEASRDGTQRTFTRQQAIRQSRASDQPTANNRREIRDLHFDQNTEFYRRVVPNGMRLQSETRARVSSISGRRVTTPDRHVRNLRRERLTGLESSTSSVETRQIRRDVRSVSEDITSKFDPKDKIRRAEVGVIQKLSNDAGRQTKLERDAYFDAKPYSIEKVAEMFAGKQDKWSSIRDLATNCALGAMIWYVASRNAKPAY